MAEEQIGIFRSHSLECGAGSEQIKCNIVRDITCGMAVAGKECRSRIWTSLNTISESNQRRQRDKAHLNIWGGGAHLAVGPM